MCLRAGLWTGDEDGEDEDANSDEDGDGDDVEEEQEEALVNPVIKDAIVAALGEAAVTSDAEVKIENVIGYVFLLGKISHVLQRNLGLGRP